MSKMHWINYDGDPQKLRDLPLGSIFLVEEEEYDYVTRTYSKHTNYIKVLGDGMILSNKCDRKDKSGWMFYEADWSSLDCGYKVLKYAIPPDEYNNFLDSAIDDLLKKE